MTRFFRLGLRALTSVLLIFLVFRITSIVHLFSKHAGIILTQEQVAQAYYEARFDLKSPTIPRIIHQIYHNWTDPSNESLPNDWEETRQTCIDFNKNWENRVCSVFGNWSHTVLEYYLLNQISALDGEDITRISYQRISLVSAYLR